MIVLCDIDGTIADLEHRIHHFHADPPEWDAFYSKCHLDAPIEKVRQILLRLLGKDGAVFYVSGRREQVRDITVEWLDRFGFPPGPLFMRADGDCREDQEVKREHLHNGIKLLSFMTGDEILCVLEDRNQVVKMWREEGLTCLQVRDGNY